MPKKSKGAAPKPGVKSELKETIRADILGNVRISSSLREKLVHPDATPLHQIPKETEVDVALSRIENMIGKGHFSSALKEIAGLNIPKSPVANQYELIRQEKTVRANIGIADRYFIRGDKGNAMKFYKKALKPETTNTTITGIITLADKTFDNLVKRRMKLVDDLLVSIKKDSYEDWCGKKKEVQDTTIFDVKEIRDRIFPDFRLEEIFGEHLPISPDPSWVDPIPPEKEFIDVPSITPGSVFRADTENPINVDAGITAFEEGSPMKTVVDSSKRFELKENNRIRASVAMPMIASIMTAKMHLFALDHALTPNGQVKGVVPLYRYEYLCDKTKEVISHIRNIESRMLPIQFNLDDFAEIVDAIRRPLAEQKAALEAINQRIKQLTQDLEKAGQIERELSLIVAQLDDAKDECDLEWWEVLVGVFIIVINIAGMAVAGFLIGGIEGMVAGAIVGAFTGVGLAIKYWDGQKIDCDNVDAAYNDFNSAHKGLQQSMVETQAELFHAFIQRDILVANINALSEKLSEVYESNEARVLDAKTLGAIQAQYNTLRQSLFTRAQTLAKLTEEAYNFERDSEVHVVKDSYYDDDKKGYTASESLHRDLDGLDYIDITGRTQKAMQLSQVVSLEKHYPMSFTSIKATGRGRFSTKLKEFDRWYPGTYMQRIKEIKVEVLVEGKPVPIRGYLSNDGTSFVRFPDPGNMVKVDNVHIFEEPDMDIAKLCYKRFQRRRHGETMSFPGFSSYLHEDRMRKLQVRERNFFENVGLETTWCIELLPDQPFELSRVTDVKLFFQYEASFDENLKRLVEKKRYEKRREVAAISFKKILERQGKVADFSEPVEVNIPKMIFEAPARKKKIINVGLTIKPKGESYLDGVAKLEASFRGAPSIQLETNDKGILATASKRPVGSGLENLENMAHGKEVDGKWAIKITDLPGGQSPETIDDVFLMLNYEYS